MPTEANTSNEALTRQASIFLAVALLPVVAVTILLVATWRYHTLKSMALWLAVAATPAGLGIIALGKRSRRALRWGIVALGGYAVAGVLWLLGFWLMSDVRI